MANDTIVITGDTVFFDFKKAKALITPFSTVIAGTGTQTIGGKKVCIEGDEKKVMIQSAMYNAPPYMGGTCMVFIDKLAADQLTKKTTCDNKKVILKGKEFEAKMTVVVPAQQPTAGGPVPDSTLQYKGTGKFFMLGNKTVKTD